MWGLAVRTTKAAFLPQNLSKPTVMENFGTITILNTIEYERSTKKRIRPSIRFYIHNFGRPRARFNLPSELVGLAGHSRGHLKTSFSSWIFC